MQPTAASICSSRVPSEGASFKVPLTRVHDALGRNSSSSSNSSSYKASVELGAQQFEFNVMVTPSLR
jgi:hypothetical protein